MTIATLGPSIRPAKDEGAEGPVARRTRRTSPAGGRSGLDLWRRVARECDAMAESLFCAGHPIPPDLVTLLAEALAPFDRPGALDARRRSHPDSDDMIPDDRNRVVDAASVGRLAQAHMALAGLIAPATPEAVLLLVEERRRHPPLYIFGPLPVVRQMLGLALLSLAFMLGVSLFPEINRTSLSTAFLDLSGYQLLMVEIFLVSAASLGSCFQNLQQMNTYISAGTYDPRFQSTYWTRWVMGVISGFVLAQLIHDLLLGRAAPGGENLAAIGEPLLALLGGYSVDLVHGILSQIVSKLGSLFSAPGQAPVPTRAELPRRVSGQEGDI